MIARAEVTVSGSALRNNFRILKKKVPNLRLIPMVKADAYGHGATMAARTLLREKGLHAFGVASFREAVELRIEREVDLDVVASVGTVADALAVLDLHPDSVVIMDQPSGCR